ncbi:ABC transporter ATP-binding protein [Reyranella sp.]|uniref:ABC transporter ATP-binding protein n=1 Tax=Reyranella sp. TaxID=1929291 RepID=UPI0025F74702|nr:ABC transporter ATP-binding protein [Reyranella sp.]
MSDPRTIPNPRTFKERFGALRTLRPFLAMVWSIGPGLTAGALLLRLVRAMVPVASLYVGKLIIDDVVHLVQMPDRPTTFDGWMQSGQLTYLGVLLLAEFGIAVLADVLGRGIELAENLLAEQVTNGSSVRLMEHAATLDLEDFEDAEFQDQLERARRQTSGRLTLMAQLFNQAQQGITVATLIVGLAVYAPFLILLLALALVPAFLTEAHFNARTYSLDFGRTPERRELDYVRQTAASVETAKEVKIFGLHGFLIGHYKRLAAKFYEDNRALASRRAVWGSLFAAVGTVGYYAAYAYIVWRTLHGDFSIGDLTFLSGSFLRLRGLLEFLLFGFSSVAGQALYLNDLFSFFRTRPEIVSPANGLPFPQPIRQGFVFEDVGFIYPGADRWAVRHLDFTLKAGEAVALVGENGAGKTTLVKLLTRLYDPDEGRILLDGRDLREYDLTGLRGSMGVIFQDFVRYNFTAGDNIAVGRIEARDDHARIERAAGRSQADEVIAGLPGGYAQRIGKRFKNGVELSGGEWQKVAIARAYMREAEVLILDEPTAALDARAEFEVFQRFKELSRGKTAVLISHRFSSVRMADRIFVLADGKVVAAGTHEELVAQPGLYAELFELQAAGYR